MFRGGKVPGYDSPISLALANFQKEVDEQIGNAVIEYLYGIDIHVDKEELIKALKYDRGQYEKGYKDGYLESRKHGRWMTMEADGGEVGGYAPYIVVECSNCGLSVSIEDGQYGWHFGDPCPWKCCPLCETKMDGGNDNA